MRYRSERFSAARRLLMLPHRVDDAVAIAQAFHEISLGLHCLDVRELDDRTVGVIASLQHLMDTSGLADPRRIGLFTVKAQMLSTAEKAEFSQAVDRLADWFTVRMAA